MKLLLSTLIMTGLLATAGPSVVTAQPLVEAVRAGNVKTVQKLLGKKSTDVNQRDAEGLTPLMVAAVAGDSAMVELLLDKGADIDAQSGSGMTALMGAAFNSRERALDVLIAHKANLDLQDHKGRTALIVASKQGVTALVTTLLEARANTELRDVNGNTALLVACGERHLHIMMELLRGGANVDVRDPKGRTPLMLLSFLGEDGMIGLMLKYKPDVNAVDFSLKTALTYAKENKRKLVVSLLEQAGAR